MQPMDLKSKQEIVAFEENTFLLEMKCKLIL
jgi:hypothetical protein